MNAIPTTTPVPMLPEWQLQLLWAVLVMAALSAFTLLLWQVARSLRARRVVHCPIHDRDAQVVFRIDPSTERLDGVVECSLCDPPRAVTCDQSCRPGGPVEAAAAEEHAA